MVASGLFQNDPYRIARKLTGRINIAEINNAINFLLKANFIEISETGVFSVKEDIVLSSDELRNLAVQTYHKAILEQSKQALEDIEMEQREFGALSFSIPNKKIKDLKRMLKNFRSEIHRWSLDTNKNDLTDCVIQLNFQMFPQTRNK